MEIFIKDLNETRELKLNHYGQSENIAEKWLGYVGRLDQIHVTDEGVYVIPTEDWFLVWAEAMNKKQQNIDMLGAYTERTGDKLSEAAQLGILSMYNDPVSVRLYDLMGDFQLAIGSERRTLNALLKGTLMLREPVNKKFWPLVNTSHTFKVTEFKEFDTYKEGVWWRVSASMDFDILTSDPNNCPITTAEAKVDMAFQDGRLTVISEHYEWSVPMTVKQEAEAVSIIQAAIHTEFAVRDINEDFVA